MGVLKDLEKKIKRSAGLIIGAVVGFISGGIPGAILGAYQGYQTDEAIRENEKNEARIKAANRAAALDASRLDARFTGSNQPLLFCYGFNFTKGNYVSGYTTPTNYDEKNFHTRATDVILGRQLRWSTRTYGSHTYQKVVAHDGPNWEYGLQFVKALCIAPIAGVSNYEVNGLVDGGSEITSTSKNARYFTSLAIDCLGEGVSGIPGQFISGNTDRNAPSTRNIPNSNNLFPYNVRGKGLVTSAEYFKKGNGGEPKVFAGGLPSVNYFTQGKLVRNLVREGEEGSYVYKLTRTYQSSRIHNTVLILLDYLIHPLGGRFDINQINLESFFNAAEVCQKVVDNIEIPYTAATLRDQHAPYSGSILDDYFVREDNKIKYALHKHEFHGTLDTATNVRSNIKTIVNSIPGSTLTYRNGKIEIFVPNEDITTANHVVDTITDSDLQTYATITGQGSDSRSNTFNLTYRNSALNLSEATVSYTNTDYLAEDNNRVAEVDASVIGMHLEEAAVYVAGARLSQRRGAVYTLFTHPYKILLYEGDVIKFTSKRQNIDKTLRITSRNASADNIQFTAEEFDIANYTYATQKANHTELDISNFDPNEGRLPLTDA